jgi:hypothetical protein
MPACWCQSIASHSCLQTPARKKRMFVDTAYITVRGGAGGMGGASYGGTGGDGGRYCVRGVVLLVCEHFCSARMCACPFRVHGILIQ